MGGILDEARNRLTSNGQTDIYGNPINTGISNGHYESQIDDGIKRDYYGNPIESNYGRGNAGGINNYRLPQFRFDDLPFSSPEPVEARDYTKTIEQEGEQQDHEAHGRGYASADEAIAYGKAGIAHGYYGTIDDAAKAGRTDVLQAFLNDPKVTGKTKTPTKLGFVLDVLGVTPSHDFSNVDQAQAAVNAGHAASLNAEHGISITDFGGKGRDIGKTGIGLSSYNHDLGPANQPGTDPNGKTSNLGVVDSKGNAVVDSKGNPVSNGKNKGNTTQTSGWGGIDSTSTSTDFGGGYSPDDDPGLDAFGGIGPDVDTEPEGSESDDDGETHICTATFNNGLLSDSQFRVLKSYGQRLRLSDPLLMKGYDMVGPWIAKNLPKSIGKSLSKSYISHKKQEVSLLNIAMRTLVRPVIRLIGWIK